MKRLALVGGILVLIFYPVATIHAAEARAATKKTVAPQAVHAASGDYREGLKKAYARGFNNILSSPAEIVIGVRDAAKTEKPCPAGGHYLAGAVRGVGKGLLRLGSGLWDLVAGWIPGHQGGMPVKPETLF